MIRYMDTWPATPRILWDRRHEDWLVRPGFVQRSCVTCGGAFTAGSYRNHLRGWMHSQTRGWWRR